MSALSSQSDAGCYLGIPLAQGPPGTLTLQAQQHPASDYTCGPISPSTALDLLTGTYKTGLLFCKWCPYSGPMTFGVTLLSERPLPT